MGSGEILLTAGLGAAAGFVLLWWVLFSCWIKSLIQAELARYVITTGDTYLRALNRLPGKLRFFNRERVAWPIWLGLVGFVPGILIGGGIIGGAGQALGLLLGPVVPAMTETWATVSAAALVMLILGTGAYMRLEKAMLVLVMSFTAATIVSALLMQTTEFRATGADILSGLTFDFPLEHAVLALGLKRPRPQWRRPTGLSSRRTLPKWRRRAPTAPSRARRTPRPCRTTSRPR